MKPIPLKELAVGSWIQGYSKITGKYDIPMQVSTVGVDYVYADFEGNEADLWEYTPLEVYPIELTEKILLDNGFMMQSESKGVRHIYKEYVIECNEFFIEIDLMDGKFYTISIYKGSGHTMDASIKLLYVHQLQAILRVFGIEKEITIK